MVNKTLPALIYAGLLPLIWIEGGVVVESTAVEHAESDEAALVTTAQNTAANCAWVTHIEPTHNLSTVGDYLDKPVSPGGLHLSCPIASAVIAADRNPYVCPAAKLLKTAGSY